MRTVDPELWSKNFKKRGIKVSRCNKFGQQAHHRYETYLRESFVDAAVEYWGNCSVPAVKYINIDQLSKGERYCYIFLLIVTLWLGIVVVSYNCHNFYATPPLVISAQSSAVFITDVNFPAVALCSNNVISKKAVLNYTDFLFNHPKNQQKYVYNRSAIEKNLSDLGALLNLALPPLQLKFDTFLHDVEPHFNVTDVMFRFTPPCSSVLTRCSWRGRLVECDTLFASRITPLGFCCVFNSRYYPIDANNEPQVLDLVGQNYGLGVVITENRDDFKYMRRNVIGAEMLLFEGSEYPLLESGDVHLYPIPRNQSLFVNIRSLTQHANSDINYYSEEWRGCRTHGQGQSWCLSKCRRATAAALCGCVPYTLHVAATDATGATDGTDSGTRVCALRDLPCLNKHREKFMYQFPSTASDDDVHLSEEIQDGLDCPECLVQCNRQLYHAVISYSQYQFKSNIFRNYLSEKLTLVNSTTLRFFYNLENHNHYSLEAYARWYEVVVTLSTQWRVVAGVSMLAAVELFYHAILRVGHHFVKRMKLANLRLTAPSE